SRSQPRATVPIGAPRDARPSAKNVLASNASYRGVSCMSWRQPAAPSAAKATIRRLRFNVVHSLRTLLLEEPGGARVIEPRIGGFNHQEELVGAGHREPRHV